ncbi:HPr family phosphocarrier protein [Thermoflavimicrobium dichotomicum]|uniref:Phosphocarrier protein HPr n=1 Tax=Thermoflavimicrobium dichotomicum TaxID=46223 RepID=A0A1I3JRR9_9BACL|nr:HPr family phosphocarrier protein [Thermoflavimicrobium dichotomicum]SFI62913.1 catabolite repression HPr-like protein/phosphocarrier protein [Thermoflavimicrobium dichotomicum]
MVEKKVIVNLEAGLHARPAAAFVQKANQFSSQVFVAKGNKKVNAKSIMGVMSLAASKGTEIVISAEGPDAEEAVNALAEIVSKKE